MESNPPQNAPRKLKFAPKAPPRRTQPKPEVKTENKEESDSAKAMNLMKQFQERSVRTRPKAEKKVNASQIAFGFGAASTSLKSYGPRRVDSNANASVLGDKEYVEPWDYYGYYPVTLPMRRPYSGNPETLNEMEFSEASAAAAYDENSTNRAAELGLLEENVEPSMFFLQLPPTVPMQKRQTAATADGQEKDRSRPSGGGHATEKPCRLDELPEGFMGKMLVYKSGAVKLKLGDTLYDRKKCPKHFTFSDFKNSNQLEDLNLFARVSPGMNCMFAQDVVAVNTSEKHCCVISEIDKHATLTPDFDSILSNAEDLF